MRLDSRKENILGFIVRDFVRTALPVSSGRIFEKRAVGASPATIRNIMFGLDEEGYLYQPHTSAGRAPTNKGYRYFVDYLMEVRAPEHEIRRELDGVIDKFKEETDFAFDELSRVLAEHLRLLSGIGILNSRERAFMHGLSGVLREPEFDEAGLAANFADFTESIGENLGRFFSRKDRLIPEVNIDGFGSVGVFLDDEDYGECVLFSVGPKRMNYEKATSILKYTAQDISRRKAKRDKAKKHG